MNWAVYYGFGKRYLRKLKESVQSNFSSDQKEVLHSLELGLPL